MAKQRKLLNRAIWLVLLITIVSGIYMNWVGLKLVISQGWRDWITSKWAIAGFVDGAIFILALVALEMVSKDHNNTIED